MFQEMMKELQKNSPPRISTTKATRFVRSPPCRQISLSLGISVQEEYYQYIDNPYPLMLVEPEFCQHQTCPVTINKRNASIVLLHYKRFFSIQ